MNAKDTFLAANAHVDEAAIQPLPNSRKVYIEGSRPDIQVPMREISQADTPTGMGGEQNPPIYVYDCSGPYTDPQAKIDIRSGLPALRHFGIDFLWSAAWNPVTDFTYIIGVSGYTFGFTVRSDSPYKSFNEYIAAARKSPGKIEYGSTGIGSSPHLLMEELAENAGTITNELFSRLGARVEGRCFRQEA